MELVFDESQKESDNEIEINCYELTKFLLKNRSEAYKVEGTKEWRRVTEMKVADSSINTLFRSFTRVK